MNRTAGFTLLFTAVLSAWLFTCGFAETGRKDRRVTIAYTNNTMGYIKPCPQ